MNQASAFDAAAVARELVQAAATATLATLGADGAPFASLVTMAATADGAPVMLLSDLAEHTRNLRRDARASLLIVAPGGEGGDPLAGARVTLTGTVAPSDDEDGRRHFLARHPGAERTAAFRDFRFYRFTTTRAHLIAGFGRIVDLEGTTLTVATADAGPPR